MPATTRVVQIDPGPIPTLTASAPASMSATVASAVATLPATMSISKFARIFATVSMTLRACPWAVSTTMTSTPAVTSASIRSRASGPVPTAAATRKRPPSSLVARG